MWRADVRFCSSFILASSVTVGCATVDPAPDLARTGALIEESTGRAVDPDVDRALPDADEIAGVLADGLSPDEAVDLALRNNRELQIALLDVAIEHADLVQAGLLSNPSLGVETMFPATGRVMVEATLLLTVSELWQIDARKQVAARELEQAILEASRQAGELVASVRTAYAEAVAACEDADLAEQQAAIADRVVDITERLHASGLTSPREINNAEQAGIAAQVDHENMIRRRAEALGELGRLLSTDDEIRSDLIVRSSMQATGLVGTELDADAMIALAREHRLDLRALGEACAAADERLAYEESKAFGDVRAGPMRIREGGENAGNRTGFMLQWALPIFDQNQAQVARAQFRYMQQQRRFEERSIAIAQEVRAAAERAGTAVRSSSMLTDELVPAAARSVEHARDAYEAGEGTLLDVLAAQRRSIAAQRDAVQAAAEREAALAALELALGMPLTSNPLASRIH